MNRTKRTILASKLENEIQALQMDEKAYDRRSEEMSEAGFQIAAKISDLENQIKRLNASDGWTKDWSKHGVSINYMKIEMEQFLKLVNEVQRHEIMTTHDEKEFRRILANLLPRLVKYRHKL